MNHPWLKKNPFMSLWLSGANRIAGAVRGQAAAQVKRSMNASVAQATQQNIERWFANTGIPTQPTKSRQAPKRTKRAARR